jgi:hypothetical protein
MLGVGRLGNGGAVRWGAEVDANANVNASCLSELESLLVYLVCWVLVDDWVA